MKFRLCNYETKFWLVVLLSQMKDHLTLLSLQWGGGGGCFPPPLRFLEHNSETTEPFLLKPCDFS